MTKITGDNRDNTLESLASLPKMIELTVQYLKPNMSRDNAL